MAKGTQAWVAPILVAVAVSLVLPAAGGATTRFVGEVEGYLLPHVYVRAFGFTDPGQFLGLVGYTEKWSLPKGGSMKGLLWFRATDEGDNWFGPELWPHWVLSRDGKWTLDLEAQYMFKLSADNNLWLLRPWVSYQIDPKYSVGVLATHTETLGDNHAQPTFLGPFVSYNLNDTSSLSLTYIKGLEGTEERELVLDWVFRK